MRQFTNQKKRCLICLWTSSVRKDKMSFSNKTVTATSLLRLKVVSSISISSVTSLARKDNVLSKLEGVCLVDMTSRKLFTIKQIVVNVKATILNIDPISIRRERLQGQEDSP